MDTPIGSYEDLSASNCSGRGGGVYFKRARARGARLNSGSAPQEGQGFGGLAPKARLVAPPAVFLSCPFGNFAIVAREIVLD